MTSEAAAGARSLMTLAEWADMPEDAPGELGDGRLVEDEDAGVLHDVVVAWLIQVLGTWLRPRGGLIGSSDTRFGVSSTRGRKPDLYAYFPGRRPPPTGLVTDPPDIMVEVVSGRRATRDAIAPRSAPSTPRSASASTG